MTTDTYPQPEHGWCCFHCGETFTTPGSARNHFGATPAGVPGCIIKAGDERGLLMALRKVEAQLAELKDFDPVIAAAYQRDHEKAVRACQLAAEYTPEITSGESPANVIQLLAALLAGAREIKGLGRATDEGEGVLTLQFVDQAAAQSFMEHYTPTVDVTTMPALADKPQRIRVVECRAQQVSAEVAAAHMDVAGYQMLGRPEVFYRADWKPTDTNNFRTLYTPRGATLNTTQSDKLHASFEKFDLTKHVPIVYDNKTVLPSVNAGVVTDWVNCPVCGESDMRRETNAEEETLIHCVNGACASNGGPNSSAIELQNPALFRDMDRLWDTPSVMGYLLLDPVARDRTSPNNVDDTLNALSRMRKAIRQSHGLEPVTPAATEGAIK